MSRQEVTGALAAPGASWCSAIDGGVRLALQITPNARKSQVIGPLEGVLKVRLQAQPIEGKANEALIRFLAEMLDVSRSKVIITHGQTSKRKLVEVTGPQVSPDSAMRRLLASEQ